MSIENSLERIAIALEKMEERYRGQTVMDLLTLLPGGVLPPTEESVSPVVLMGEPLRKTEPGVEEGKGADREALKKTLRALGIKFKDASRTETLEKLLADHKDSPADSKETHVAQMNAQSAGVNQEDVSSKITEAPEATMDDVRNVLVSLSALKGKDVPLGILKTVGKSDKLSQVKPELYRAIIAACEEAEK